jgi:hypothetical protein
VVEGLRHPFPRPTLHILNGVTVLPRPTPTISLSIAALACAALAGCAASYRPVPYTREAGAAPDSARVEAGLIGSPVRVLLVDGESCSGTVVRFSPSCLVIDPTGPAGEAERVIARSDIARIEVRHLPFGSVGYIVALPIALILVLAISLALDPIKLSS